MNLISSFSSYEVGSVTKNQKLCDQLYTCPMTSMEILEHIKHQHTPPNFGNEGTGTQIRGTCQAAGKLCPGVSVGCGLCAMFMPGICGSQCIIAGIYCGTSALACKAL